MHIVLGALNPWSWRRRRKWRAAYEANPVFSITSPMEVTALLIAAALLTSSTHLLGKGDEVNQSLAGVLQPSAA